MSRLYSVDTAAQANNSSGKIFPAFNSSLYPAEAGADTKLSERSSYMHRPHRAHGSVVCPLPSAGVHHRQRPICRSKAGAGVIRDRQRGQHMAGQPHLVNCPCHACPTSQLCSAFFHVHCVSTNARSCSVSIQLRPRLCSNVELSRAEQQTVRRAWGHVILQTHLLRRLYTAELSDDTCRHARYTDLQLREAHAGAGRSSATAHHPLRRCEGRRDFRCHWSGRCGVQAHAQARHLQPSPVRQGLFVSVLRRKQLRCQLRNPCPTMIATLHSPLPSCDYIDVTNVL